MDKTENNAIIDVLLERHYTITINERKFKIKPLSLGKTLLLSKYVSMLKINVDLAQKAPLQAIVDMCKLNEDVVNEMLAIYLTTDKDDFLDVTYIQELAAYIKKNFDITGRATLLQMYLEQPSVGHYMKILGLDKEREKLRKIQNAKGDSSSIQIGGISLFGSIIDAACERYKWTYDYVVWGISYTSLQLMMIDAVQTIFLTDKEKGKIKISTDGINLSGDNKEDVELIKQLIKN